VFRFGAAYLRRCGSRALLFSFSPALRHSYHEWNRGRCLELCTVSRGPPPMAPSNGHVTLREELVLGRRALLARFRSSPTRTLAVRLRRQKLITGSDLQPPSDAGPDRSLPRPDCSAHQRVLRSLRDDQIVNLEKHCVTILDIERLRRLARNGPLARARSSSCTLRRTHSHTFMD
jgi:hypothetical protein